MVLSKRYFAKTKVVCTLGPSSSSPDMLKAMVMAGMDVGRLNFSHGSHAEHLQTLQHLRTAAAELNEPVSVIQDLQGPKLRIGDLKKPSIELRPDQSITITTRNGAGDEKVLSTTYRHFPMDVKPGDR